MTALRLLLAHAIDRSAIQIPLQDKGYGVRVAVVADKALFTNAAFVLAANAQLPAETLRSRVPKQVKIGPVEKMKDLVNLALPGVGLHPLPVVPRQIPFHAGFSYFELDKHGEMWAALSRSAGVGLHIPADYFPGIELELWAIRG